MKEYVLKSGVGFLWGVSTGNDQPGKTLTLYDGEIILASVKLDTAFPHRYVIGEEEGMVPGIELNQPIVTDLRIRTDGQVDIDWC